MDKITRRKFLIGLGVLISVPAILYAFLAPSYRTEIDNLFAKPSPPASDSENSWD
jgi:hypothetical protein